MIKRKVFYFVLFMIFTVSCEKEELINGNDQNLLKFWRFTMYTNDVGKEIDKPSFNPDTLFHYEVNIQFLWNDYSKKYEIQGQGPYRIFWGEYKTINTDLELTSLYTSLIDCNNQELHIYDSLFFASLINVTSYSIKGENLELLFGEESKAIQFELKSEQYIDKEEYMTAKIDDIDWTAHWNINADIELGTNNEVSFKFQGMSSDSINDGGTYSMFFVVNLPLEKKEYSINNIDSELSGSYGDVSAVCSGTFNEQNGKYAINYFSRNGTIGITLITPSFIEGYFNFDAVGKRYEFQYEKKVTKGKFLIPINSGLNWLNNYYSIQ